MRDLTVVGIITASMHKHIRRLAHPHSPFRIFGVAVTISILVCAAVGILSGLEALFSVLVLAVIELTFSFDNAVVNAKVLERMPRIWQIIFLTVGIAIAVFGVRMFLPLALVAITADLSLGDTLNLALYHAEEYAHHLEEAHAVIAAFGGSFLLMIFLHFLFEDRDVHWFHKLESPIRRLKTIWVGPLLIAMTALCLASVVFAGDELRRVLTAGFIGIAIYSVIKLLSEKFQASAEKKIAASGSRGGSKHLLQAGLFSFIYLELLDASFSFDGVVAAFAITKNVVLIAAGLGIGAIFVRSLTVFLLRRGTLYHYIYLEHGAYYAIGTLAVVMLTSIGFEIPSFITGTIGVSIIGLAIVTSKGGGRRKAMPMKP